MPTKIQEDKNGRVLRQETITSKRKLLSDEYLLTTCQKRAVECRRPQDREFLKTERNCKRSDANQAKDYKQLL
jgi:hypothetical protein